MAIMNIVLYGSWYWERNYSVSGSIFKYDYPAVCITTDTYKLVSLMDEEGTSLQSGLFSSGKTTGAEDVDRFLKYLTSTILNANDSITQKL